MKTRQKLIAGAVAAMLLASTPVWSGGANGNNGVGNNCQGNSCGGGGNGNHGGGAAQAPEIDAASGTTAIVLLTGVLLLVGERKRARGSARKDVKNIDS